MRSVVCDSLSDTVERITGAGTVAELEAAAEDIAHELGYAGVTYSRLSRFGEPVAPRVMFGDAHDAWMTHYARQGFAMNDPVIPMIFRRDDPFTAGEVEQLYPKPPRLHADRRTMWARDGLFCPISSAWAEIGVVCWAASEALSVGAADRVGMACISRALVTTYRRAAPDQELPGLTLSPLSPRETECVYWLCEGLRPADIAGRLKLSVHTVRQYIGSATDKLQAINRGQMTQRAMALGLVTARRPPEPRSIMPAERTTAPPRVPDVLG